MNISQQPLVSIVTPVYNGGKYLAECIESVLTQTYQNWDYTIVNNCSTDKTLEIAEKYAKLDTRIRIHNNEKFVDITANHNIAFRLISPNSKYCKVVESDDWLFPDCISRMVEFAEAHKTVGFVVSYAVDQEKATNIGLPIEKEVIAGREVCRAQLLWGPYILGSPTTTLYRSDLIKGEKNFYKKSTPHHDMAACYEYLYDCDFGFIHQILAFERLHDEQISSTILRLFTWAPTNIYFLMEYGPKYLTEEEYQKQFKVYMDFYYKFLALAIFQNRGKEFWDYHKNQLKSLGYPLSKAKLVKVLFSKIVDALKHLKQTIVLVLIDRDYFNYSWKKWHLR